MDMKVLVVIMEQMSLTEVEEEGDTGLETRKSDKC